MFFKVQNIVGEVLLKYESSVVKINLNTLYWHHYASYIVNSN